MISQLTDCKAYDDLLDESDLRSFDLLSCFGAV